MIQCLKGNLTIPPPYNRLCFRTAIISEPIDENLQNGSYKTLFEHTEIFIVEICSRKKYTHDNNGFYLHHLCVDPKFSNHHKKTPENVLKEYTVEDQSDEEIEQDILDIQQRLYPKRLIIVSHYDSKLHGKYIDSRHELIRLLQTICETHDIPFVNPTHILRDFRQEEVIQSDLGHYTETGIHAFSCYMNGYIMGAI